jgi:hypothetical protein
MNIKEKLLTKEFDKDFNALCVSWELYEINTNEFALKAGVLKTEYEYQMKLVASKEILAN